LGGIVVFLQIIRSYRSAVADSKMLVLREAVRAIAEARTVDSLILGRPVLRAHR